MTTKDSNTHNPTPADQPLALRLSEGLGPNARKLASQLQNAAYNCGYEDAHPSNATTRQAKADTKCREVLAALYAECDRLAAAEAKTNSYIVDNARLAEQVESLRAEVAQARETAEYWKAEHLAGNARIGELHDELAATDLRSADHLRKAIKAEAEIERLRLKCQEHRDGRLAALERVATLERTLQEVGDLAASSATGPAQLESLKMIEELCGLGA